MGFIKRHWGAKKKSFDYSISTFCSTYSIWGAKQNQLCCKGFHNNVIQLLSFLLEWFSLLINDWYRLDYVYCGWLVILALFRYFVRLLSNNNNQLCFVRFCFNTDGQIQYGRLIKSGIVDVFFYGSIKTKGVTLKKKTIKIWEIISRAIAEVCYDLNKNY